MKPLSLKTGILLALVLTSSMLTLTTIPMLRFGYKEVVVKVDKEPVFVGRLNDVAVPYASLAVAISLLTGVTTVAIAGWKQALRQSNSMQEKLASLEEKVEYQESLLEHLAFADYQKQEAVLAASLEPVAPEQTPQPISPLVSLSRW